MLIIYQCFGSTHSSIIASYIHLGKLPEDRVPGFSELVKLPHFDRLESSRIGRLNYIGTDSVQNHVFAMGSKGGGKEVRAILKELLPVLGINTGDISMVNCLDQVNLPARIGGFMSRQAGVVFVGRPLVALGIKMRYMPLVKKVQGVRQNPGEFNLGQAQD